MTGRKKAGALLIAERPQFAGSGEDREKRAAATAGKRPPRCADRDHPVAATHCDAHHPHAANVVLLATAGLRCVRVR